ncbi:proline-rich protein 36-like [Zea mays]|uniref:Uncharacterized protein n=1 Tax=Zea mays TaxID=4577 RepID=C4J9S7_MAIZE|nr:proline-rich protein 36-like [Zea mays]XP_020399801.1 proline-rich protein 36-like [Zea mays]XP_020399804.1 proline-rich protein 36-like [Zea mays]XP_020399805.1 proline-rich protein 36-like [Zea mays]ACR37927.1 unknown [Zea mays]|eukprot:NP_001183673.1 uncharacterized protein LOC100502267 [Zea mays]
MELTARPRPGHAPCARQPCASPSARARLRPAPRTPPWSFPELAPWRPAELLPAVFLLGVRFSCAPRSSSPSSPQPLVFPMAGASSSSSSDPSPMALCVLAAARPSISRGSPSPAPLCSCRRPACWRAHAPLAAPPCFSSSPSLLAACALRSARSAAVLSPGSLCPFSTAPCTASHASLAIMASLFPVAPRHRRARVLSVEVAAPLSFWLPLSSCGFWSCPHLRHQHLHPSIVIVSAALLHLAITPKDEREAPVPRSSNR